MVGCPGAQINLSVKSAIRLPANDCLERDIAELQSKTWKLGQKGVAGAKSGRKAYEAVPVLHPYGAGQHGRRSNRAVSRHTKRAPAENRRPGPCAKREPQYRTFFIFLLHQCRRIMAIYKFVSWFSWQSRASKLYSNSSTTISGFDPSRSGGPHVPAPLEVKTCIFPIRLKPYTSRR